MEQSGDDRDRAFDYLIELEASH